MFTQAEYDFLTTLLTESGEWDDNPPLDLIKSINEKLQHLVEQTS